MERTISDEEKIRRAIEISQRRNNNYYKPTTNTMRVNVSEKKDYKLFKKMVLQMVICLLIYIIFYLITSTNYVFSKQIIKSTNEILNYDINLPEIYNNLILFMNSNNNTNQKTEENNINIESNNTIQENEQVIENNVITENQVIQSNNILEIQNIIQEDQQVQNIVAEETIVEKTQMELDAESAKKICKFLSPLAGRVTSEFGEREVLSEVMSADHKGIDIAANSGTSIISAITGTVSVAEENSQYGKFVKIVNGDVMTVYAHCQKLKVKVGDKVKLGQTIATVGSTGNSTGPHLHFEIRFENRYINPRLLINF